MNSFARIALLIALALCLGCKPAGPPVAVVKGRVTAGNKPLTSGVMIFQAENGPLALTTEINAQGEYQIKTYDSAGLPPGKYKVAIKPAVPARPEGAPVLAGEAMNAQPLADSSIPKKYHDISTSGLSADVTLETKAYDFELTP
ncbi:hypothetical protein [Anatilimnocola floriformis]|uniref:hypothetical protein n=1 Tax=Anatilimnocola floriformis TaxID=2948575 RepID=UPI0020C34E60|nr:hypothetical protein [Anatilimnocola floriformis]